MNWPFDFSKTHRLINDLQNQLNAFVIDLPQLQSSLEIQHTLGFDGAKDLTKSNQLLERFLHNQNQSIHLELIEELERLHMLYALRNRQLWVVDHEFIYDEIGEVIKHCLAVQFAALRFEMPPELRQVTQVLQREKQMSIFGRQLQFDFRDFPEETLEKAFHSFDIAAIEFENREEKTLVKPAIQTLYQSATYEPGDGVMIQTQLGSYFVHKQSNKNHFITMQGNQAFKCKTCIGPPKASRCSTTVLATQ